MAPLKFLAVHSLMMSENFVPLAMPAQKTRLLKSM